MKSAYFKTAYFFLDDNFLFNLTDISQIEKRNFRKKMQFGKRRIRKEAEKNNQGNEGGHKKSEEIMSVLT